MRLVSRGRVLGLQVLNRIARWVIDLPRRRAEIRNRLLSGLSNRVPQFSGSGVFLG